MTTEQILDFVEKNPQFDIQAASFQRKNTNGSFTEELSLALYVEKKKPLSEIPVNKIIPTGVYIDGFGFIKTDVMQGKTFPDACADCAVTGARFDFGEPIDTKIMPHREIKRPLQGGISISSIPSGTSNHENIYYQGTLGFIAVDELDGSLVAVSNAHVAAVDQSITGSAVYAHNRVLNTARFTTKNDVYNFQGYRVEQSSMSDFGDTIITKFPEDVYHPINFYDLGVYENVLSVGYLKRYMPLTTGNNSVDCAIIGLNQQTVTGILSLQNYDDTIRRIDVGRQVLGAASWQILGHDLMGNQRYYPFATTEEINSTTGIAFRNQATASTPNIVFAGRTTGLKGQPNNPNSSLTNSSCILEMQSTNFSFFNANWGGVILNFTNLLSYSWKNCTNLDCSRGGDSGSAVLARFNGIWKIIGLHFASQPVSNGGSGLGIGVRIDHIAPLLKIRPYMGQPINNPATGGVRTGRTIVVRNKQSLPFINHTDGRTYYQMGTTTQQATAVGAPTMVPSRTSYTVGLNTGKVLPDSSLIPWTPDSGESNVPVVGYFIPPPPGSPTGMMDGWFTINKVRFYNASSVTLRSCNFVGSTGGGSCYQAIWQLCGVNQTGKNSANIIINPLSDGLGFEASVSLNPPPYGRGLLTYTEQVCTNDNKNVSMCQNLNGSIGECRQSFARYFGSTQSFVEYSVVGLNGTNYTYRINFSNPDSIGYTTCTCTGF